MLVAIPVLAEEKQKVYMVTVNFDKGVAKIDNNLYVSSAFASPTVSEEQLIKNKYYLKVVSFEGKKLFEKVFSIKNEVSVNTDNERHSGMILEDTIEHLEIIPYYKDGAKIFLYNANRSMVDEKDISHLSETCGDGVCAKYENYTSCRDDCLVNGEDGFCNSTSSDDPDCVVKDVGSKDKNDSDKDSIIRIITIVGLLLAWVVFLVLLVRYLKKTKQPKIVDGKKNNQIDQDIKNEQK